MPRRDQAWLNAYEAKMRGRHPEMLSKSPGVEKEKQLHKDILAHCKSQGWIAFHGSMIDETSRTLGEPDFQIYADGGKLVLIECKTDKGKLSRDQAGIHAWLSKLGHVVYVVRSMDDYFAALKDSGVIK